MISPKLQQCILAIAIFMSACGMAPVKYKTLPQAVYVYDKEQLGEATNIAMEALNNILGNSLNEGEVGELFFDPSTNQTEDTIIVSIQCDKDNYIEPDRQGRCVMYDDGNGFITRSLIYIRCDDPKLLPPYDYWTMPHLIAHELYHCLGFYDHPFGQECLSADPIPSNTINDEDPEKNIESLICPEMIEQFDEVYNAKEEKI